MAKKYFSIFLGDSLWENVIDDMNTTESWAVGGMLWTSKSKALSCMKNLKNPVYGFESKKNKFKIKELKIK